MKKKQTEGGHNEGRREKRWAGNWKRGKAKIKGGVVMIGVHVFDDGVDISKDPFVVVDVVVRV